MDFFPKNLFDVVKYTQTKNMKNENFDFGATQWSKNEFENSKSGSFANDFFFGTVIPKYRLYINLGRIEYNPKTSFIIDD